MRSTNINKVNNQVENVYQQNIASVNFVKYINECKPKYNLPERQPTKTDLNKAK